MHPLIVAAIAAWNVVAAGSADAWLEARHQYLTASDVAAVLGLHPHKSRNAVLKDKRGPVRLRQPAVKAMRAGHFLEPAVLEWYLDDLRQQAAALDEPPPVGSQCRNPEGTSILVAHPDPGLRLAASPDGLILESTGPLLAEVKVHGPTQWALWTPRLLTGEQFRRRTRLGLPIRLSEDDPTWPECPVQHWVQLQVQLLCCGVGQGVLLGNCGSERREHRFEADPGFHARVIDETTKFWTEVGHG